MTGWPVPPQYGISTPYGKRGNSWSCNENSDGQGVHTGCDMACPEGTPLYATIAGEIRHRNYGSAFGSHQFAISPDLGEPFGDGEVFYAHARSRLADGTRVEIGDKVGEAGAEGNATGPHLHYEYHPHSKDVWGCSVHADPAPTLSAGIEPGPVYLSKLHHGQRDSDSVRRLQAALNAHPLQGGETLPITGDYLDETDEEVRLCQAQHGYGEDPPGASFVGPSQADHLFTGTGCEIINDVEQPPDPEAPDETPEGTVHGYGLWTYYSGKHDSPITVRPGEGWVDLPELEQPASGITAGEPREDHFCYTRWELTAASTARRVAELRFVRSDGDATAYDHRLMDPGVRDSYPFPNSHTEAGSGLGGHWQARVTGGSDPVTITTRYAKTEVRYQEPLPADEYVSVTRGPDTITATVGGRIAGLDPAEVGALVRVLSRPWGA